MKRAKGAREWMILSTVGVVALASVLTLLLSMSKLVSSTTINLSMGRQVTHSAVQINGKYEGTVAITMPVSLGDLDLSVALEQQGDAITGTVKSLTRTLAFQDGTMLYGNVTQDVESEVFTFVLQSETFTDTISNRQVLRSFIMQGLVLDNGEALEGHFTETITGYTPIPMEASGPFQLLRPALPSIESEESND